MRAPSVTVNKLEQSLAQFNPEIQQVLTQMDTTSMSLNQQAKALMASLETFTSLDKYRNNTP